MKEFVEKLIGRLEEKFKYNSEQAEIWRNGSDKDAFFRERKDLYMDRANTYGEVMRIANQLAEEYKPQLNDNDLMIVESLPSLYPMKEFEEEALKRVIGCAKKEYNNGWIACSERLPEYTGEYNVTVVVASELGSFEDVTTLRFENIKGKEPRWVIPKDEIYRVIAWMELPKKYQKGE